MHALSWNVLIHHICTHAHTLGRVWAKCSCSNCIPMYSVELSMGRANRAFNWPPSINHYHLIIRYPILLRKKLNALSILTRVRDGAFVSKCVDYVTQAPTSTPSMDASYNLWIICESTQLSWVAMVEAYPVSHLTSTSHFLDKLLT
jgi:hypothetical protein